MIAVRVLVCSLVSAAAAYAVTPSDFRIVRKITGAPTAVDPYIPGWSVKLPKYDPFCPPFPGKDYCTPSLNDTSSAGRVAGMDLGIVWDASWDGKRQVVMAFGDTFAVHAGPGGCPRDTCDRDPAHPKLWRSNTLALSEDETPEDGITMHLVPAPDGLSKEILPLCPRDWTSKTIPSCPGVPADDAPQHCQRQPHGEDDDCANGVVTVIPNGGIMVDGVNFLHYMSVTCWDETRNRLSVDDESIDDGNIWIARESGIACSNDMGGSWSRPRSPRWLARDVNGDCRIDGKDIAGLSNFGQAALVRDERWVYLFGVKSGRIDGVKLARVPANKDALLDRSKYEYWDGTRWHPAFPNNSEVDDESRAAFVVVGPVAGELSVQYHERYRRWLMAYFDHSRDALVLRDAKKVTGPWSGERIIVTGNQQPSIYTAFIHPWFTAGADLYMNVSLFEPYNVFFSKATVRSDRPSTRDNMLSDPGFEDCPAPPPWLIDCLGEDCVRSGRGCVDCAPLGPHASRGAKFFTVPGDGTGWRSLRQKVVLAPYQNYRLTADVATSGRLDGYFGARMDRGADGWTGIVLNETGFGSATDEPRPYRRLTVNFNSHGVNQAWVYAVGFIPDGTAAFFVDDASLTQRACGERVTDPGFEDQRGGDPPPWPWWTVPGVTIERDVGQAHEGRNDALIAGPGSRWLSQEVPVDGGRSYRASAWLRTSDGVRGQMMILDDGGFLLGRVEFGSLATYSIVTTDFTSPATSAVKLAFGYSGPACGSPWLRVDDVSIRSLSGLDFCPGDVPAAPTTEP